MKLIKAVLIALSVGTVDAKKKKLQGCISAYPGTSYPVNGKIVVKVDTDTNDLTYSFRLREVEVNVTAGTHIHTGTTCLDASAVGGHYWNNDTHPDPWVAAYGAVYTTNSIGTARGSFTVNSGYGYDDNLGRAVVVHAADGTRVGCGVLGASKVFGCGIGIEEKKLEACISPYPGTSSDIFGKIAVTFNMTSNDLTYKYKIRKVESSVTAGTHIHTGTTCDDASLVGGHYWNNDTHPDPWVAAYGAVYTTKANGNANGNFTVNSGYGYDDNVGRAVVVHAANGTRIGCGVLGKDKAKCFN